MGWILILILIVIVVKLIVDDIKLSHDVSEGKKIIEKKREEIKNHYYNTNKYFEEGYKIRQQVTNDFFFLPIIVRTQFVIIIVIQVFCIAVLQTPQIVLIVQGDMNIIKMECIIME